MRDSVGKNADRQRSLKCKERWQCIKLLIRLWLEDGELGDAQKDIRGCRMWLGAAGNATKFTDHPGQKEQGPALICCCHWVGNLWARGKRKEKEQSQHVMVEKQTTSASRISITSDRKIGIFISAKFYFSILGSATLPCENIRELTSGNQSVDHLLWWVVTLAGVIYRSK